MFSLYFNCKLTKESVTPGKPTTGFFFPVMYPKRIETNQASQYKVLLATIKTYSKFKFDTVIFNISIESINLNFEDELRDLIQNNYIANNLIINFERPSTVQDWIFDVKKSSLLIKKNSPVLVVMNHDHPYIDYSQNLFNDLVTKIFPDNENNFGKALYYSHAPEVISLAINGSHNLQFNKQSDNLFISNKVDNWIDSICVMTMETLEHIWSMAKFDGDYIGRFDWGNVSYSRLGITFYVFPREFFKHFDGYGHVTGIRLISELNLELLPILKFPNQENINDLVYFYYQKWIDCFIITLREIIRLRDSMQEPTKSCFIQAIELSLDLFNQGYLKPDVTYGFLSEDKVNIIEAKLRSHIFYMGNSLFSTIKSDLDLLDEIKYTDRLAVLKKYTPNSIIKILKTLFNAIK